MLKFESNDPLLRPGNFVEFLAVLQLKQKEGQVSGPIPALYRGKILAIEYARDDAKDSGEDIVFEAKALQVEVEGDAPYRKRCWTLMWDDSWGGWSAIINDHIFVGESKITANDDAYSFLIARRSRSLPMADDDSGALDKILDEHIFGELIDFEDVEDIEEDETDE